LVSYFKECPSLGSRYDKLAVTYIGLWFAVNIGEFEESDFV